MENRTVSLWINQSEKKSRTVSLWINQSEKSRTVSLWINQSEKSRTVSLWINQSGKVRCQRVRKRDKPARQEKKNRRRTVSTFIEKRDKPELKEFCYFGSVENFCLTMMYSLKKFRKSQTRFSRKSRKISLQSKRISKRRNDRCCIAERRESIQRKEGILQVAPNCAALKSLMLRLSLVVVTFIRDATELSY